MSDTLHTPPASRPDGYSEESKLGLPQASALVMGSIIGVGIFSLPYSLASYGPISIIAMAITTVGALALALMYSALSKRIDAPGGPYAYSRAVFGNLVGFFNAWSYWITAWAGNAAIATGWVYPKVKAAVEFIERGMRGEAVIGALGDLEHILAGEGGTRVSRRYTGITYR